MFGRITTRVSLILALAASGFLPAGCSDKDDERPGKPRTWDDRPGKPRTWDDRPGEYRDETGFGILPPEGWTKSDPPGELVRVAFQDPNSRHGTNFNVVAEDVPSHISMDEVVQANLDNMDRTINGLELLNRSDLQIDGLRAKRVDYKMREMGMELRGVIYIVLGSDYAYYLVGTTLPVAFDKAGPIFERVAKSMKVR
jgi:hypothetical protein